MLLNEYVDVSNRCVGIDIPTTTREFLYTSDGNLGSILRRFRKEIKIQMTVRFAK